MVTFSNIAILTITAQKIKKSIMEDFNFCSVGLAIFLYI